jgi:hypothetical protein
VELIWHRFESAPAGWSLSIAEGDDTTLSVCLVISWPPHELVDRAAEFSCAGELLRTLINLFQTLAGQDPVITGRSRIEDGRFIGWLTYGDVLTAQDAFLGLHDALRAHGLTVELRARDERVPFTWLKAGQRPVVSQG